MPNRRPLLDRPWFLALIGGLTMWVVLFGVLILSGATKAQGAELRRPASTVDAKATLTLGVKHPQALPVRVDLEVGTLGGQPVDLSNWSVAITLEGACSGELAREVDTGSHWDGDTAQTFRLGILPSRLRTCDAGLARVYVDIDGDAAGGHYSRSFNTLTRLLRATRTTLHVHRVGVAQAATAHGHVEAAGWTHQRYVPVPHGKVYLSWTPTQWDWRTFAPRPVRHGAYSHRYAHHGDGWWATDYFGSPTKARSSSKVVDSFVV